MKIFLFLVLFLAAGPLPALEISRSLAEMVRESEIIVIADLSQVKTWYEGNMDYGSGVLTVRKGICGGYKSGDTLALCWQTVRNIHCGRNEHRDTGGQQFIWLLKRGSGKYVVTGTNQRVRDLHDEATIDSLLRFEPIMLVTEYSIPENEPGLLRIGFRNVSDTDMEIAPIRMRNGKLYLDKKYELSVVSYTAQWGPKPGKRGMMVKAAGEAIRIPPKGEYYVDIPLRKIFSIEAKGAYRVQFQRRDISYFSREIPSSLFYYIQ